MKHHAAPDFWVCYSRLPAKVEASRRKALGALKSDPQHRSLHLKKVDDVRSARVGLHYHALAIKVSAGLLSFYTGTHAEYDDIIVKTGVSTIGGLR